MKAECMWVVEEVETTSGDIQDTSCWPTALAAREYARRAVADGIKLNVALVRTDYEGDREWAYLRDDGTLPASFVDAYGYETCPVPRRFLAEARKAAA